MTLSAKQVALRSGAAALTSTLMLLAGCQPAPPHPPNPRDENSHQIYQLERHRAAFDAYAAGDHSDSALEAVQTAGVSGRPDATESGRLQFNWLFRSAMDEHHPILFYCPHGEADLPADFWTNDRKYLHPYQIDDHWFAALRSWMRDPPPRR